jgi:hypothetical protein
MIWEEVLEMIESIQSDAVSASARLDRDLTAGLAVDCREYSRLYALAVLSAAAGAVVRAQLRSERVQIREVPHGDR